MKVSFVQTKPEFGKKDENIQQAVSLMKSQPADLYVLPELFTTGYVFPSKMELAKYAESARGGPTFKALGDFAKNHDCGIVYGFSESDLGQFYNSCVFVNHKGDFKLYRKLHLFFKEKELFTPGNLPLDVFEYKGAKLGMMVCFDWIFPEVTRILALKGADIICHPANLVLPYCQDVMKARSIENMVFTITANRVGAERISNVEIVFTGQSQITDCKGNVLYRANQNKEEIYTADINIEDARAKNLSALNNLWQDRRVEYYQRLIE